MIAALIVAGAVGAFVALGFAMRVGEGDGSHSVRPVPPRPARPADPAAWVDPEADATDAAWRDPGAVAA